MNVVKQNVSECCVIILLIYNCKFHSKYLKLIT